MFRLITLLFCISFSSLAYAQKQRPPLTVKGDIVNSAGIGINQATVKILGNKDGLIYFYSHLGAKNSFIASIDFPYPDSVKIVVSHQEYESKEYVFSTLSGTIYLGAELVKQATILNEVEIKVPPIWKRGDTTFYKVEAFKEGEEKKLKDILLKMPDFDVDDRGNMRFKKKVIEKITVDGEEIFADKTKLLVDNFPVHVLDNIQAIENQSNQKLLKGLSNDNRVFLNLGLDKKIKLKAAFGDGEMGVGSAEQYNAASLLFSIYGKLKAGYIGNWNSIGNGIGYGQERELKNSSEISSSSLLMNNHTLSLINNFENRWYINNRQLDNRLQINGKLSEKISNSTELSYLSDRQTQQTYFNNILFTGDQYEVRIDSTTNRYLPRFFGLKQSLVFNMDTTQELKIFGNIYFDQSKGSQYAVYKGLGISSPLEKSTQNKWGSYTLSANYVKRHDNHTASEFTLLYNRQYLNQKGLGNSLDFDAVFAANYGLNFMQNNLANQFQEFSANYTYLIKNARTKYNWNYNVDYQFRSANIGNEIVLGKDVEVLIKNPLGENMMGDFSYNSMAVGVSGALNIYDKPIKLDFKTGYAKSNFNQLQDKKGFEDLIIQVTLDNSHKLFNRLSSRIKAQYLQEPRRFGDAFTTYYPNSLVSFSRNLNDLHFTKRLEINYSLGYRLPNTLADVGFSGTYNRNFNSLITRFEYQQFLSFSQDSLTKMPTEGLSFSVSSQIPSLLVNALFNLTAGYFNSQHYIFYKNMPVMTESEYYYFILGIKKNWNKKYYIRIHGTANLNIMKPPKGLEMQVTRALPGYKAHFFQRLVLNKQWSWISNLNYFNYGMISGERNSMLLLDSEWRYNFKNRPFFISIIADNLLGEDFYYNFSNSGNGQVFRSIPLRPRSIYASLKYNF